MLLANDLHVFEHIHLCTNEISGNIGAICLLSDQSSAPKVLPDARVIISFFSPQNGQVRICGLPGVILIYCFELNIIYFLYVFRTFYRNKSNTFIWSIPSSSSIVCCLPEIRESLPQIKAQVAGFMELYPFAFMTSTICQYPFSLVSNLQKVPSSLYHPQSTLFT